MSRLIIYTIAFMTGFAVMGYEILCSRVLIPYYGNTVYIWGSLLAVFMTGLAIGYTLGGRMADRFTSRFILPGLILGPILLFGCFPLYGVFLCKLMFAIRSAPRSGVLLAAIVLCLPPCIFLGCICPYLIKIAVPDMSRVGTLAGNIYSISTLGSVAGALFTSFFMISWIGTSKSIQLLAIPLLVNFILCIMVLNISKFIAIQGKHGIDK